MQKLVNRQARAITGMFRSTPEDLIIREAGLTPAKALLNARQGGYEGRLLSLSDGHPTKEILPISLRRGDGAAQPGEQPIDDIDWAEGRGQNTLSHYLARQLAAQGAIDPAEGVEPIVKTRPEPYPGVIVISLTEQALEEAREPRLGLVLWSDGSRLEHGGVGAAAAWRQSSTWQTCKTSLGKSKEIFDAELWGVSDALKVALDIARNQEAVTIFLDSQAAIKKIRNANSGAGQAIASQIHERTQQLIDRGHTVVIRWVPGHAGVEGNEVADQAAKQAAEGSGRKAVGWSFIAHVRRKGTEALAAETKLWLQKRVDERNARHGRFYTPPRRKGIDHTLAKASKALTGRFLQLKAGHAVVGTYLYRIKAAEDESCG